MKTFLTFLPVILIIGVLVCAPRTNPEDARRVLESSGYTEIHITGFRPWMASKDEWYSTGFEATTPTGKRVTGAVTSGVWKGQTIRFD